MMGNGLASKLLKTFMIHEGGSVEGGEVKNDGKVIGFDYISNIIRVAVDPILLYRIYVNRYPCKAATSSPTRFRNPFSVNPGPHYRIHSAKLFQATILNFDNDNAADDVTEIPKIKGCGSSGDTKWNGCDENATPVLIDACQALSPQDSIADNADVPDVTNGTALTAATAVETEQQQRARLYQAPIFQHPRLYQAPIVDVDGSGEEPEDVEGDTGSDGNGNTKVKLSACPPPPQPSTPPPMQTPPPTPPTVSPPLTPPTVSPPIIPTTPPPMMMRCFSGDTVVTLRNNQKKRLDELDENDDWILSAGDNRIGFNKMLSWLHRMPNIETEFIKFTLENGKTLKITKNHYIYKAECSAKCGTHDQHQYNSVAAEKVLPSDCLLSLNNDSTKMVLTRISKIETVIEKGIYAPLTDSGDILVNDIFASCYSEIDNQYH
uniref:Uncharacterized protein n=1 Tax=Panagrolaimus davidi TaxID=227884 RepID=A0A914Q059_9BILA